jgi:hypothetical protein
MNNKKIIDSKLSLCKKIQYTILENKKLDWLKRKKEWKLDRKDLFLGMLLLSILILSKIFGKVLVVPMLLLFYIVMLMFLVRQIKSVPSDIESIFLSLCIGIIFLMILSTISIVIALVSLV